MGDDVVDNAQTDSNKKIKILLIIFAVVVCLSIILVVVLNSLPKEITYLEFESLEDEELSFSLILGLGKSYTGKILTDGKKFDEKEIMIISDNPSIATVELGSIGKGYINYKVTSKYNGTLNIYAQTKDGKVRTSNKKFIISGGKDTIQDGNISIIKNTINNLSDTQVERIASIISEVGFNRISTLVYDTSVSGVDKYAFSISNGLVVNMEIKKGEVKTINVQGGSNDNLILYDNGFVHAITQSEIKSYKEKQDRVYDNYLGELAKNSISLTITFKTSTVKIQAKNLSNQEIKYVYFQLTPYNAVGDVEGNINKGRIIGPISSGSSKKEEYTHKWTKNVKACRLSGLTIVYLDNTQLEFTDAMISKVNVSYA